MGKGDFNCHLWVTLQRGLIPAFPRKNTSFPSLLQSKTPRFSCNLGFGALAPKLSRKSSSSPKNPTATTPGSSRLNPNPTPPESIPLDPSRLEQQITGAFPERPKVWDTGGNICSWPGRAGRGRCELFNSGAMTSINNGRCFPTCGKRPGKQLDPNQSIGSRP